MTKITIQRIAELMERDGFTQTDLADRVGLTQSQIHRILAGKNNPKAETIRRMGIVFGVDAEYLLGTSDTPKRFTKTELSFEETQLLDAIRHKDANKVLDLIYILMRQQ